MKDLLKKFGKVEKAEQIGSMFHIKITTGFDNSLANTLTALGVILDEVPDYPLIETMITDKNMFYLVLTKI